VANQAASWSSSPSRVASIRLIGRFVDHHTRDSALDANVQGVKIRKAHENCFPRGVYVSGHPNAPIGSGRRCIFVMVATVGSPSAGFHGSRVDSRHLAI
jgi:hypothetical protein